MDDYRLVLRTFFPLWMGYLGVGYLGMSYLVGCQIAPTRPIPIETREVALHHKKARIFSPSGIIAAPAPVFQDSDAAYASGASYEYGGGAKTFAVGRRSPMSSPTFAPSLAVSSSVATSSMPTATMPVSASAAPVSAIAATPEVSRVPEVSRDHSLGDTATSATDIHHVMKGETLYAISRQYGLPVGEIARANALSPPYALSAGQKLRVSKSHLSEPVTDVKKELAASQSVQIAENNHKSTENHLKETQQTHSFQKVRRFNIEWSWPNNGSVISKFSVNGNKGIDIRGEMGEAVHAAASGKVVYSGNGLRGYGNMIIVQHDNGYLTAYAHNSKLLVNEGSFVKAGQKIAEIGSSEAEISKLHFEIRKDGNPVDPIDYLPARTW